MRLDKTLSFFANVGGVAQTQNTPVPSGETWVLLGIDFAGPSGQSSMQVEIGPTGSLSIISASGGDKYVQLPGHGLEVSGPQEIEITLQNRGAGQALLGCTIYYEKL